MNTTIDINCELQPINGMINSIVLSGFNFNNKGNKCIVTVHHGLPINKCFSNNKLSIVHNCIWNELLILESREIDSNIYKKYKCTIPKKEEHLYIKNNDTIITITHAEPVFIPLHEIPTNPPTIYLKCNVLSVDINIEQSMSGSPVFDKNNYLVGILSKKNNLERSVYIIPIYILIKTLMKSNNNTIFDIDYNDEIKKINGTLIKNNMILHKSLNILVPVCTYFMIEGDDHKVININKQNIVQYYNINDELHISNSPDIISINNKYELTIRFIKLIKLYSRDIFTNVYDYIQRNYKHKIYIYINIKRIIIENMIEFDAKINDIPINVKITCDAISSK